MESRIASALLLLPLAFALAACERSADKATIDTRDEAGDVAPVQSPTDAQESDPVPEGSEATAVVHHARPDPLGFDRKAFAGAFSGTLPCADCPGIDARLEIAEGGTFALNERRRGDDASHDTIGTWTIDAAGTHLLLDPDDKDAADRHFEVVSNDELRALDAEGDPVAGADNAGLRRD
jgi:copper homeostasis protein (lipoprotein)